jgi:hypothetical protein
VLLQFAFILRPEMVVLMRGGFLVVMLIIMILRDGCKRADRNCGHRSA